MVRTRSECVRECSAMDLDASTKVLTQRNNANLCVLHFTHMQQTQHNKIDKDCCRCVCACVCGEQWIALPEWAPQAFLMLCGFQVRDNFNSQKHENSIEIPLKFLQSIKSRTGSLCRDSIFRIKTNEIITINRYSNNKCTIRIRLSERTIRLRSLIMILVETIIVSDWNNPSRFTSCTQTAEWKF